jgi:Peptidase A4 family
MHLRGWTTALLACTVTLMSAVAVTMAESAPPRASVRSAVSPSRPAGRLHSAPAHWVSTLGPHVAGTAETAQSTNWSGYVDTGATFTAISGSWVVPAVQPSSTTLASGTWIGIDGAANSSLIQTGTAQLTTGGATDYYDWYELLPAEPVNLAAVSPGDKMHASIVETSSGKWTITIADVTSGRSNSVSVSYADPQDSAEWIEEAPTLNDEQSDLADFGTVQFSGIAESNSDPGAVSQIPVDMVNSNNTVIAYPGPVADNGFTVTDGAPAANSTTSSSGPHGYWLVGSDGGIFTFGSAQFYGSTGGLTLQRPVVDITLTDDRNGYWLVASDGGIFSFGDAGFYGSIPGLGIGPAGSSGAGRKLNAPIVGMVPSTDGGGYFMVASDGGVFAFGDAKFEGSCPSIGGCSGAAVAVMPDASGNGYWLVTATGHVYSFGDATYYGAPGPQTSPVTSAVRTPGGGGYWILFANGAIAAYGDAADLGAPLGATGGRATAIFSTSDGGGYWVSSASGTVFAYGDAANDGDLAGHPLNGSIVAGVGY